MLWRQVLTTIQSDDLSVCPPDLRDEIRQACDELMAVNVGERTTSVGLTTRQVFDLARRFATSPDLREESLIWKRHIIRHYCWVYRRPI